MNIIMLKYYLVLKLHERMINSELMTSRQGQDRCLPVLLGFHMKGGASECG